MGTLVHINKIFPFTEDEIKTIKGAYKENPPRLWFSYSEVTDKECIYTKDDCNTDLAFISMIGKPNLWDWMLNERGLKIKMTGYGFSDNASQAIKYAEQEMKDSDKEYCIVLIVFKPTNDMNEKFCYGNGPYLGVLEKPPFESTLYGVHIPENMKFMFHFYIFTQEKIDRRPNNG